MVLLTMSLIMILWNKKRKIQEEKSWQFIVFWCFFLLYIIACGTTWSPLLRGRPLGIHEDILSASADAGDCICSDRLLCGHY